MMKPRNAKTKPFKIMYYQILVLLQSHWFSIAVGAIEVTNIGIVPFKLHSHLYVSKLKK
jgi:hypothetical protein